MAMIRILVLWLSIISAMSLPLVEASPQSSAVDDYFTAINRATLARNQLDSRQWIATTQSISGKTGDVSESRKRFLVAQADRLLDAIPVEVPVEVPGKDDKHTSPNQQNVSLNWQMSVLFEPTKLATTANLLRETEDTWIFSMPVNLRGSAEISEGGDSDAELSAANQQLQQGLVGELTISKNNPQILSVTIFAKKPFKPASLTKVKAFKVPIEYDLAWPNGPLVVKTFSKQLNASYAVFFTLEEFETIQYTDFQLLSI